MDVIRIDNVQIKKESSSRFVLSIDGSGLLHVSNDELAKMVAVIRMADSLYGR